MNGSKRRNPFPCLALLPLFLYASVVVAEPPSEDLYFSICVTIDGKRSSSAFLTEVISDGRSAGIFQTNEEGIVRIRQNRLSGKEIYILPYNETAFTSDGTPFFAGEELLAIGDDGAHNLAITKNKITTRPVFISDEKGAPVSNIPVDCKVSVPMSKTANAKLWQRTYKASSDKDGKIDVKIIEDGSGAYNLSVDAEGIDGNRYAGNYSATGNNLLLNTKDKSAWKVKTMKLSLDVQCIWDPDISRDAFLPNVSGNIPLHILSINSVPAQETAMDEKGKARFYDIPSGSYKISFSAKEPLYLISRKTDEVVITNALPIKHTLALLPTIKDVMEVKGVIESSNTTEPVHGAILRCGKEVASSGSNGAFVVKAKKGDRLLIEHKDYRRFAMQVPSTYKGEILHIPILKLPTLSGKILEGENSVGAYDEILLMGKEGILSTKCDEKGTFQIALEPGEYRLQIKKKVAAKNGRGPIEDIRKVLMHDEKVTITDRDAQREFKTPGVSRLSVEVNSDTEIKSTIAICLLRKPDGKIAASAQLRIGEKRELIAPAGEYNIFAALDEKHGMLFGEIKLNEKEIPNRNIRVGEWREVKITPSGCVEF